MISIKNLHKQYGETVALRDISLDVNRGELFGLIGPDGAGKTSLFRILTTLLLADSGTVSIDGLHVVEHYKDIRNYIGYMPGRFSLYQDLSVEENLSFFATVFGTTIEENYDLIADIYRQIEPYKSRLAGKLSGGMKQKLALSCALIHKPTVLILDEPTTGVDAVSRVEFWEMLKRLQQKGITIMVSTPYMDEASLCDRVALIQKGEIMALDTPTNIMKQFPHRLLAVKARDKFNLMSHLKAFPNAASVFAFGETVHFTTQNDACDAIALKEYLHKKGHQDAEVEQIEASIEDCFMQYMQQ